MSHKFATYWIAACISVHSFAIQCEAEEGSGYDTGIDQDFIAEGLSDNEDVNEAHRRRRQNCLDCAADVHTGGV